MDIKQNIEPSCQVLISAQVLSLVLSVAVLLSGCSGAAPDIGLYGYVPPPAETSVTEELKLEYARCLRISENSSDNTSSCAQQAYDVVRKVKGLPTRSVPEGIVIILRGDGNVEQKKE